MSSDGISLALTHHQHNNVSIQMFIYVGIDGIIIVIIIIIFSFFIFFLPPVVKIPGVKNKSLKQSRLEWH